MAPNQTQPQLSDNAWTVYCKRYPLHGDGYDFCPRCQGRHETPAQLFRRVAMVGETPEDQQAYYDIMERLDFLPNSPTLFNANVPGYAGTLSACFKFDVQDSLLGPGSIMDVATKAAAVQKWGGGVGYCLSALRPKGAPIKSTHGYACGPVSVMNLYHGVATMITQGGKREGAQMAILHVDHPDIQEFIHCKEENPQALSSFNISVAVTDAFMTKASSELQPGPDGSIDYQLLRKMAEAAWYNGEPGVYFIDTAEASNPTPWLGKLTGTNPCGETPLLDNEPCNLGSINLAHFVIAGASEPAAQKLPMRRFDFDRLAQVSTMATRFLDDILDHNLFPDSAITDMATLTRKLGLGVMGWADALALLHIHYDSDEAVKLGESVMRTISQAAHEESIRLAYQRGPCPALASNPATPTWHRRNATLTCIAPTGSISILAGVSNGIEPHFSLEHTRRMGASTGYTELLEVPGVLDRIEGFKPHTAHEISWRAHIKMQAAFQAHTDLAVSKTINLPNSATVNDVYNIFIQAWRSGCKGLTVYRDGSRNDQPLKATKAEPSLGVAPTRHRLPRRVPSERWEARVGNSKIFIHHGWYPDTKEIAEIFLTGDKEGSTISGLLDAFAIATSLGLQFAVDSHAYMEALANKMINRSFPPNGLTDDPEIPTATSLLDYVFRSLLRDHRESIHPANTGMLCPDCGAPAITQEGCLVCAKGCGWSKC